MDEPKTRTRKGPPRDGDEKSTENKVSIPVDTINEQIVVAAVLVDQSLREQYVQKEPADRFADTDHALIWTAIRNVLQRGKGFDLQLLHAEISGKVKLEYLRQLVTTYPKPPVNMASHVARLRHDHMRKQAAEDVIPSFIRVLRDPQASPAMLRQAAERVGKAFQGGTGDRSFMLNPKLIVAEAMEDIRKRSEEQAIFPFGIPDLDNFPDGSARMIPGAEPGQVTLITGASGSGKSVLAAMIALQQVRLGRRVMMGAWEMGEKKTLEMMAIMSFTVPHPETGALSTHIHQVTSRSALSSGQVSQLQRAALQARMDQIAEWVRFFPIPFAHDPAKKVTNEDVLGELNQMVDECGCEVVVYDLFERCMVDNSPGPERRLLFAIQAIHKRTNTHGILVCQQKVKEVEKKADRRPARDTIFGSAAWVEIADSILGAYRPAQARSIPDDTMELLILKQRYGRWPLAVVFDWDADRLTIMHGREADFEFGNDQKAIF